MFYFENSAQIVNKRTTASVSGLKSQASTASAVTDFNVTIQIETVVVQVKSEQISLILYGTVWPVATTEIM